MGLLAFNDLFNLFDIALAIHSPATPVTLYIVKQTFALPPEQSGPRDVESVADLVSFVFLGAFACNHDTLSGMLTYITYIKYSYDNT